jgi:hypothetical protein
MIENVEPYANASDLKVNLSPCIRISGERDGKFHK